MFPEFVLDKSLIDVHIDFLLDENQRIAIFYPKNSKSFLMCAVLGHDYYQVEQKNEEGQLTETLTYCIRCKLESIEKFQLKQQEKIPELIN